MEHRTNLGLTEKQWGALISGEKEVKRGRGALSAKLGEYLILFIF